MKIAVVQLLFRDSTEEDAAALRDALGRAVEAGADLVMLPDVAALHHATTREIVLAGVSLDGVVVPHSETEAFPTGTGRRVRTALGDLLLLRGDEALAVDRIASAASSDSSVAGLVLCPGSESDLQAEAVLELALGLSESVAGFVVLCEPTGGGVGEPGHGGSAVVLLGEVVAEAVGDEDDVLFAEVPVPVPVPEPREPVPSLPPILDQRVAHHEGRKPAVGYPADLS